MIGCLLISFLLLTDQALLRENQHLPLFRQGYLARSLYIRLFCARAVPQAAFVTILVIFLSENLLHRPPLLPERGLFYRLKRPLR